MPLPNQHSYSGSRWVLDQSNLIREIFFDENLPDKTPRYVMKDLRSKIGFDCLEYNSLLKRYEVKKSGVSVVEAIEFLNG